MKTLNKSQRNAIKRRLYAMGVQNVVNTWNVNRWEIRTDLNYLTGYSYEVMTDELIDDIINELVSE